MNAGIGEQSHASGLDAASSSRVFRRHDHPVHRALLRKEGEGMSSLVLDALIPGAWQPGCRARCRHLARPHREYRHQARL